MEKKKLEYPKDNSEYVIIANAAEIGKHGMSYNEAKQKAKDINDRVNLHNFTVKKMPRIVAVKHFDGSYLEFHSASFKKLDEQWMAVFTEHHGFFVYNYADVKWIRELNNKDLYRYKG